MKLDRAFRIAVINFIIGVVVLLSNVAIPAVKSAYHQYRVEQIAQERQVQIDSLSDEERAMYEFYDRAAQSAKNPPDFRLLKMRVDTMVNYYPELLEDDWFRGYYSVIFSDDALQ